MATHLPVLIGHFLRRELRSLCLELEAYPDEQLIWTLPPGLPNSAGTLASHLAGNLRHYVGAILGGNGYIRNRDEEFAARDIPREVLLAQISEAEAAIESTLPHLSEEQMALPFPEPIREHYLQTDEFLIQLAVHLAYHLGQVSYHRRLVTGNMQGVGALSAADLVAARTIMDSKPFSDSWESGSPYEQYVGRWSRRVAPLFLSWLNIPAGRRWLDVGCGTGALCAAIVDRCSPASVTGVEPSEGFLETAKEKLAGKATLLQGRATAIPLDDTSVDVVVSGLVLNFVPDQHAALAEMARVAVKGGTIAAYVWDYAGKMEMMRYFWDAAAELDRHAADLDEGNRFPLCHPDALEKLFADAGLEAVEVRSIDIPTPFADFEHYWQPFLGGQGPAPAYTMSLDEPARARLRDRIRERLPIAANGSIALTARVWAVRATVAETNRN